MLHLYEPALLKLFLIGLESSFQQADGLISRLPGCDSGRLQGSLWFGLVILLTWRARSYCRGAAEELPRERVWRPPQAACLSRDAGWRWGEDRGC